jgi:hypothetical protein
VPVKPPTARADERPEIVPPVISVADPSYLQNLGHVRIVVTASCGESFGRSQRTRRAVSATSIARSHYQYSPAWHLSEEPESGPQTCVAGAVLGDSVLGACACGAAETHNHSPAIAMVAVRLMVFTAGNYTLRKPRAARFTVALVFAGTNEATTSHAGAGAEDQSVVAVMAFTLEDGIVTRRIVMAVARFNQRFRVVPRPVAAPR